MAQENQGWLFSLDYLFGNSLKQNDFVKHLFYSYKMCPMKGPM